MKIVEFPKQDDNKDIQGFLDEAKTIAEEEGVTDAIVIMMDAEGNIGMSVNSSYLDATAMLAIAMKSI
jgi:hypothetical protein